MLLTPNKPLRAFFYEFEVVYMNIETGLNIFFKNIVEKEFILFQLSNPTSLFDSDTLYK